MTERLGNVLYWAGCILAMALLVGAGWVLAETQDPRPGFWAFVLVPAVAAYLTGWALRYILSNR